jgi:anti-sigma B factor antagonist
VGQQGTLEVEIHSANAAIVTLRGEHDLGSKPAVTKALATASGCRNVLVDLSECTFIDSSVISALLQASNRLTKRHGLLELVIPSGAHQAVRSVFELMGLQRLLPIHETRAAAIEYLDAPPPATTETSMRLRALSEIIENAQGDVESRRRAA